jgi:tetratricopeptide (TPR) repeat protein
VKANKASAAAFAALLVSTLIAYHPAWFGLPLWDDDAHLTRASMRSWEGLRLIWVEPRSTQQYYPLMHSAFWVMHRLWGDATLGYHLVNIVLHATSAWLLLVLLRRLAVPGALFAAFLFALHPVQVESVAWITELKNTLSTPFYLLAALAYLRFDDSRRAAAWAAAVAWFAAGLLIKTVVATLPFSLLVLLWWKRGSLTWRGDVRPIVPLAVLALAGGLTTAWAERTYIGATGAAFDFSLIERLLIAGRAVCFYAATLVWPVNLTFTYPRWSVSQAIWWQYVFLAAVAAVMVLCWRTRRRSRGPLAALLLYGIALGPALGFFNIYPFVFSFVADHFQYTATLAGLAFLAAGSTTIAARYVASSRVRTAIAGIVLALLAAQTWHLSHQYVSAETLYRSTIARNPSAWMAYQNLGGIMLIEPGADIEEAASLIRESLRLKAGNADAHNNLGYYHQRRGDLTAARREYEEAIRLNPKLVAAHNNVAALDQMEGRLDAAEAHYRESLRLDPYNNDAGRGLALTLTSLGRTGEASAFLARAFHNNPGHPDVLNALGEQAVREDRPQDAIRYYEAAAAARPGWAVPLVKAGSLYDRLKRLSEATARYEQAVRADPSLAVAHDSLGYALLRQQRFSDAADRFREAIRLDPSLAEAHASLGAALQALGQLDASIAAYRRALGYPVNAQSAPVRNSYGVSLAQRGRLREAADEFREALRLDPSLQDARNNLARVGAGR